MPNGKAGRAAGDFGIVIVRGGNTPSRRICYTAVLKLRRVYVSVVLDLLCTSRDGEAQRLSPARANGRADRRWSCSCRGTD